MNIHEYMDAAKARNGLPSDRALDRLFGFKTSACSFWRNGRAFPAPDNMVELAELGGLDPHIALIDLGLWCAEKDGKDYLVAVYQDLKNKVKSENNIAA